MALRMITTSKVVFMTFDVLFDVVIFVVVINSFRRCDNSLFDVLIALINLFDVVMVCMVFGVLFGFRRSDFRSSDLFPFLNPLFWENARKHLQHGPWEDLETDVQISSIPIFLPIKPISFADLTLKLIIAVGALRSTVIYFTFCSF